MSELTKRGIAALKNGDRNRAQQLLRAGTRETPDDVQAWLWLSGAVETDEERAACLQQVLRLDPENPAATQGLAKLIARGAVSLQANAASGAQDTPSHPAPAQPTNQRRSQPAPKTERPRKARARPKTRDEAIFEVRPSLFMVGVGVVITIIVLTVLLALPGGGQAKTSFVGVFYCGMTVVFAMVMGFHIFRATLARLFTRYTLTSKRLIVRTGLISRSRKVIPVSRIQDVSYKQNILERLVGIGDVIVESAGEKGAIRLMDLPNCHDYSEVILDVIHE